MFKTTRSWTAGLLISSALLGAMMILSSWLLKGTPYSGWVKDGFFVLWCVVFFAFAGNAPAGTCRFLRFRKT